MRAVATATQIHQPSPGRGHTNAPQPKPRRQKAVKPEEAEGSDLDPIDARKPWERRVLFTNLSPEALEALQTMAKGTRYQDSPNIKYRPKAGLVMQGPLRTFDYFERLCALRRENPAISFSAWGQRARDNFYPLQCGENDERLVVIVSEARVT